jgi:lipopolysaccharide transport system permease protein
LHDDNIQVYTPGRDAGWGLGIWREMVMELWLSRELIWRLFKRDFSAKYRQSVLGIGWAVINPVSMVVMFWFLNRSGVVNIGETSIPYPAYALLGITIWQVFGGGLVAGAGSITASGNLITKINLPRECLVIASMGQVIFETAVRLALVAAVFAYYGIMPAATAALLPLALIPLFIFALGMSLMLSLLNVVVRDTVNMLNFVVMFLLFLTPVLYPRSSIERLESVAAFNPFTYLVNLPRELVISGDFAGWRGFAGASLLSFLVFLTAWRIFHLVETRVVKIA